MELIEKIKNLLKNEEFRIALLVIGAFGLIAWFKGGGDSGWFFAIFFGFAIIMQLNGIFIFINFIQIVWNPLIVPLITILIIGALVNSFNSWWRRKLLSQEEDI